jgi:hypothetical protein
MKRQTLFTLSTAFILILTLLLVACGASPSPSDGAGEGLSEAPMEPRAVSESEQQVSNDAFQPNLTERLVIRNADLELVFTDTEAALEEVQQMVQDAGGYVVSSQRLQFDAGTRINVTVRVPAELLDDTLARLREMALEVRSENVTGEDVTEEYTDLQARLRHLEAVETQLLGFMEEAEDTEATLAVYRELQKVQQEIEQVKGRIQFLEQSAALSTISIRMIPDALAGPISVAGWRPGGTLRQAVETLVRALQFIVDAAIWIVIFVLPIFLLVVVLPLAVLIWVVRRVRGRRGDIPRQ